jgi:DNA-3-methyladenine glycosylase
MLTARAIARLAPLPRSFYVRDPLTVARELLGKLLIRTEYEGGPHPPSFGECGKQVEGDSPPPDDASQPGTRQPTPLRPRALVLAGRIIETEAYLGLDDPAAHAYRGPTPRTAVLFGPPGHAYVYFIYGNHYCTNVTCQPAGQPGCVLLRALEPVCGISAMAALRNLTQPDNPTLAQLRRLTSGPGRLSSALAITRPQFNACDLCSRSSGLYIAADPNAAHPAISTTPRINVTHAPHEEYRFFLTGNPFVSGNRATRSPQR